LRAVWTRKTALLPTSSVNTPSNLAVLQAAGVLVTPAADENVMVFDGLVQVAGTLVPVNVHLRSDSGLLSRERRRSSRCLPVFGAEQFGQGDACNDDRSRAVQAGFLFRSFTGVGGFKRRPVVDGDFVLYVNFLQLSVPRVVDVSEMLAPVAVTTVFTGTRVPAPPVDFVLSSVAFAQRWPSTTQGAS
jgi:hypothetical protein